MKNMAIVALLSLLLWLGTAIARWRMPVCGQPGDVRLIQGPLAASPEAMLRGRPDPHQLGL